LRRYTQRSLLPLPLFSSLGGKTSDRKGPVIRGITFTQYAYRALEVEGKKHFTIAGEPTDEPVGPSDPATFGKEVVGTMLENVTITQGGCAVAGGVPVAALTATARRWVRGAGAGGPGRGPRETARSRVFRGANPGTDSQFPANCAGNSVSVPGLRRIAAHRKNG
jgi:hypothetical protein